MSKKGIDIDGAKLKSLVLAKEVNMSSASRKLGLRDKALIQYISRNKIPAGVANDIEIILGIPFSEYSKVFEKIDALVNEKKPVVKEEIKPVKVSSKIDGMKLRNLLCDKGLSASYVSRELGYNSNYIANACSKDRMSIPGIKAMCNRFDLKYEDFAFVESEPVAEEAAEEKKEEVNSVTIDMDQLYETIFSATYKAMKQALTESVNELTIIQQSKLEEKRKERRTYRSMHPEMFDVKEGY